MKKVALFVCIVCLWLTGCAVLPDHLENTECEHDWQRTSNLNESTAVDTCTKCGETRKYTDPDSVPKSYRFSGSVTVAPKVTPTDARTSSDEVILNILNRGLWERDLPASDYDYIITVNGAELWYDSVHGTLAYSAEWRHAVLRDADHAALREAVESLFIRISIPNLNMPTLQSLVDMYGESLTWDNFASYYYVEESDGDMHILRYPIGEEYSLVIGGVSEEEPPAYIHLVWERSPDVYIDVRTESIDDFITLE